MRFVASKIRTFIEVNLNSQRILFCKWLLLLLLSKWQRLVDMSKGPSNLESDVVQSYCWFVDQTVGLTTTIVAQRQAKKFKSRERDTVLVRNS